MWSLLPLPHMVMVFLVLHVPAGKGFICAVCSRNSSNQDFGALPALFATSLPAGGLRGRLVEVRPEDTHHHPIKGLPDSSFSSAFTALIHRHNRSFAAKVLQALRVRDQAAVGYLVSMASEADTKQKIHVPSIFTAGGASSTLKWLHCSGKPACVVAVPKHLRIRSDGAPQACKCHIRLPGPCLHAVTLHLFWISCIPVSTIIALLLIEKYLSKCKKWKEASDQLSQEKGNEQTGFLLLGSKYQECAICLEKYLEYDSLKVLSCSHAFHSRCIDLWHITQPRSKTCPLCMQKVMLVVRLQTLRLWKEEARGHPKNQPF